MKKIIAVLLACLLLAGCGGKESSKETQNPVNSAQTAQKGPTQEEINAKLKAEAVKASFVELNGHTSEFKNKKVYAEGKVSNVDYKKVVDIFPSFVLSQKEGNGYGMYVISNMLEIKGISDGDKVKIYGVVDGTDKTGMIKIVATIIEKQ
jgi:hypothetical protein